MDRQGIADALDLLRRMNPSGKRDAAIAAIEELVRERDQHWETIIRARDELLEWRHNETHDDGTLSEAGVAYDSALDLLPDALEKSAPDHDAEPDYYDGNKELVQPEEADKTTVKYCDDDGTVVEVVEGSRIQKYYERRPWERIGKVRVEP